MISPPLSGRHSGRATPSLRATPTRAHHIGNRQRLHLSSGEICPDKAGQLYPMAQYYLGYIFSEGQGLTRDYAEALKWYRKAADSGNMIAETHLGSMYQM